jgi:hypothetical protein
MLAITDRLHATVPYEAAHDLCYLCNDYCGAPYFATGVVIDMEGEIVIGKGCADTITSLFGGLNSDAAADLVSEHFYMEALKEELLQLREFSAEIHTACNKARSRNVL